MLHLQLACNISNAFGVRPRFEAPVYRGRTIPHLDFAKNPQAPLEEFSPFTAQIGPLDREHVNAMCLVEYPGWGLLTPAGSLAAGLRAVREYGSIGEMYEALEGEASRRRDQIRGNQNQVDLFGRFYARGPGLVVTRGGDEGFSQVQTLIHIILEQGEGRRTKDQIRPAFRNLADDPRPADPHYEKFLAVRAGALPKTWPASAHAEPGTRAAHVLEAQVASFGRMLQSLEQLFGGGDGKDFPVVMATAGAAIGNCWRSGVVPRFSSPRGAK